MLWVHGNSTIQLKQIIRYGHLEAINHFVIFVLQPLHWKLGVMKVHNILFLSFLQKLNLCLLFLLPPVPHGTSASSWWNLHPFSIVRKHGQSPWGSRQWLWSNCRVTAGLWTAPMSSKLWEMLSSSTIWLDNLQKPSESYLAAWHIQHCPTGDKDKVLTLTNPSNQRKQRWTGYRSHFYITSSYMSIPFKRPHRFVPGITLYGLSHKVLIVALCLLGQGWRL